MHVFVSVSRETWAAKVCAGADLGGGGGARGGPVYEE